MKNYNKIGLLGEGSHAKVFLVEDEGMQKYALKRFNLDGEQFEEVNTRFLIEKTALTRLRSQNIVQLIDVVNTDEELSLIMEYCEYGSIKEQFELKGRFTLQKSIKVGLSILSGLEDMHEQALIHRDIKPDNVLQGNEGILKIADMGLVKGTEFDIKICEGTVAYMAPEQYLDYHNVDERSDIYSVGATLYELYTGSRVFDGKDIDDILDSHQNCIVPSLKELRSECPLSFNHVIRKMIAKNPADRYPSATEAKDDLEAIINGSKTINELPSIRNFKSFAEEQSNRPKKQKRTKVFAILAGVFALVVLTLTFVNKPTPIQERPKVKAVGLTVESGVTPVTSEVEKPIEAVVQKPIAVKPKPKLKPRERSVVYIGKHLTTFPVKLLSIHSDRLSCEVLMKAQETSLTLGQKKNDIQILKIRKSSVIVEIDGDAYEIDLEKKHRYFAGHYKVNIDGDKKLLKFNQRSDGYTLVATSENSIDLKSLDGKTITLKQQKAPPIFLQPILADMRNELREEAKGHLVKLVKYDHDHLSFTLTGIAKDLIQLTDENKVKTVHKKNDIILKKLQVIKVEADYVEIRDVLSSRTYTLRKNKKPIVRKAAIFNYRGKNHRVIDNSVFFSYLVNFKDDEIVFKSKSGDISSIGKGEKRAFLK
ncbi:MAG: serine/threonine protein kinase [Lentisphaeraceae bacterium]|nr:serine/threonine protein kinase [Lentisphaeraceae bacterium]